MTVAQWVMATGLIVTIGMGLHEISDSATAQGKSITEAINRNTEAIKTQTNRCTPPTRGSP